MYILFMFYSNSKNIVDILICFCFHYLIQLLIKPPSYNMTNKFLILTVLILSTLLLDGYMLILKSQTVISL